MGKIRSKFQELKEILTPMTWEKRFEYLWTYYKWVPIGLAVLIFVVATMVPSIVESNKEVVFGGMCINIDLSEEAEDCLNAELFAHFGGTDPDKERVTLSHVTLSSNSADTYASYTASTAIAAQITARELDYVLMDTEGKDYFTAAELTTSLEKLLTAEQLEALQDKLIYRTPAEGEKYPFAIDITDTPFAAACGLEEKGLYMCFPGNTVRAERIDEFVDYLLNWE